MKSKWMKDEIEHQCTIYPQIKGHVYSRKNYSSNSDLLLYNVFKLMKHIMYKPLIKRDITDADTEN